MYAINPFISLILGISSFKKTSLAFMLSLFVAFFGSTMYYNAGDAANYKMKFEEMHQNRITYDNFTKSLFDGETNFDIAIPFLSFLVAMFTGDARILFALFGLVFGYFYGKNIEFISKLKVGKKNYLFLKFIILIFSLIVPFWDGVNGVRMWTGAHIFFYGASNYFLTKNKKYFLFLILSFIYHFSYVTMLTMFIVFWLFKLRNHTRVLFYFFLVSIFITQTNIGVVKSLIEQITPSFFAIKVDTYTSDEYVKGVATQVQSLSLHAVYFEKALNIGMYFLLIITYLQTRKQKTSTFFKEIFSYTLFIYVASNILSILPSGSRFLFYSSLISIIPITIHFQNSNRKQVFSYAYIPLVFFAIVRLRISLYFLTIGTIVGNPFVSFLVNFNESNLDTFLNLVR